MPAPPASKLDANQILKHSFIDATGELRVSATATIGTVDVILDAAGGDNVAISDGVDTMAVNPDGSINVQVGPLPYEPIFVYNAVSGVAANVATNIISYTVPAGKTGYLQKVYVSGENIAKYTIRVNATIIDVARTYFGQSLDKCLEYASSTNNLGYEVGAGDVITVQVLHTRPSLAEFNGRIQVLENV